MPVAMQPGHPMKDDSKYCAFVRELHAVRDKILVSLEQNKPLKVAAQAPKSWAQARTRIRTIAEDLMLCPDIDRFVESFKKDQAIALVLVELTTETDEAFLIQTMESAFRERPAGSKILPGQAFAMFLLEICSHPVLKLTNR